MRRLKITLLGLVMGGISVLAVVGEIGIAWYPPVATLADGRQASLNPGDVRLCMGARVLASLGDRWSQDLWFACAQHFRKLHALEGIDVRYWILLLSGAFTLASAFGLTIFATPSHPYTLKLVRATPRPGVDLQDLLPEGEDANGARSRPDGATKPGEASQEPLLVVENLIKEYPRKGVGGSLSTLLKRNGAAAGESRVFRAVGGIRFVVHRGESVGFVGESGCGKSTTSTMVMRLTDATAGRILFDGQDIGAIPARNFAQLPVRRRIQMVFQDPTDSLNPRFTAARAIADPILRLGDIKGGEAVRARCEELARQVGLPIELLDRFPHQLSGGQKVRVGIARAIALKPDLVILDEPTAALDVFVQAVVLNLLQLKEELGMSYLFVSHDLNVVRLLCDRVIVMRAGRIVEEGPTERVLFAPAADYTRKLLAAIPHPPV